VASGGVQRNIYL